MPASISLWHPPPGMRGTHIGFRVKDVGFVVCSYRIQKVEPVKMTCSLHWGHFGMIERFRECGFQFGGFQVEGLGFTWFGFWG